MTKIKIRDDADITAGPSTCPICNSAAVEMACEDSTATSIATSIATATAKVIWCSEGHVTILDPPLITGHNFVWNFNHSTEQKEPA